MSMPPDPKEIQAALRTLLDEGLGIGDALRRLHFQRGLGMMFIWPAVVAVLEIPQREAMKLTVHEINHSPPTQQ